MVNRICDQDSFVQFSHTALRVLNVMFSEEKLFKRTSLKELLQENCFKRSSPEEVLS